MNRTSYIINRCIWCGEPLYDIDDKNRTGRMYCRYTDCAKKMHIYVKDINKSRKMMESDSIEKSRMKLLFDICQKYEVLVSDMEPEPDVSEKAEPEITVSV